MRPNFFVFFKDIKKSALLCVSFFALSVAGCQHTEEKGESGSYITIARKMHSEKNYNTAHGFYSQALEKDPDNKEARIGIARMLKETNRPHEALKELRTALKTDPNNADLQVEVCRLQIELNQAGEAKKTASSLCEKDPKNPSYLNLLAVSHDLSGEHQQARDVYQKAIALNPDDLHLRSNLGLSYALAGETAKSLTLLEEVAGNPHATAKDRQNLAIAYSLAGLTSKAKPLFLQDLSEEETLETLRFLQGARAKPLSVLKNTSTSSPLMEAMPKKKIQPKPSSYKGEKKVTRPHLSMKKPVPLSQSRLRSALKRAA